MIFYVLQFEVSNMTFEFELCLKFDLDLVEFMINGNYDEIPYLNLCFGEEN